jgi:hypothetical protein
MQGTSLFFGEGVSSVSFKKLTEHRPPKGSTWSRRRVECLGSQERWDLVREGKCFGVSFFLRASGCEGSAVGSPMLEGVRLRFLWGPIVILRVEG